MEANKTGNKHKGKQVKRFRESIGMKQEVLANELGTSQQNISNYEKQEDLSDELFAQLAKGMGVSPEVLLDFNSEAPVLNIQEMRENSQAFNFIYNFNPMDKIIEQSEKIEQLYKDLLESERDKIAVLSEANKALQAAFNRMQK